jgi:thiol:disulfide interchange protein DsbG
MAEQTEPMPPRENPAFKKFQDEGGKIEFLGRAMDLDGWVLVDRDGKVVTAIYVSPSGALIKGWLFDQEGRALTPQQIAAFQARINGSQASLPGAEKGLSSKAENFYAAVERSAWVRVGSKDAPYIYVFINISCEHCQALWKKLIPAVDSGRLQVRLVPFGWEEMNREGGAALLSAPNPQLAWQKYIDGDKSFLSKDKIAKGALDRLEVNNTLARKWKVPDVPFTIYKKLSDGVVTAIVGLPDNLLVLQADLIKNK